MTDEAVMKHVHTTIEQKNQKSSELQRLLADLMHTIDRPSRL